MIEAAAARRVRLLGLDVDGVLTDNGIYVGPVAGERVELKRFDIQDGLGLMLLRLADLPVVWLSGRESEATTLRGRELRVDVLASGSRPQEARGIRGGTGNAGDFLGRDGIRRRRPGRSQDHATSRATDRGGECRRRSEGGCPARHPGGGWAWSGAGGRRDSPTGKRRMGWHPRALLHGAGHSCHLTAHASRSSAGAC